MPEQQCPGCGAPIKFGETVCDNCGTSLAGKNKKGGKIIITVIICAVLVLGVGAYFTITHFFGEKEPEVTEPVESPDDEEPTYDDYLRQAKKHMRNEEYEDAISAYEDAINEDSRKAEPYLGAAEAQIELGREVEALAILERGLRQTRDDEIAAALEDLRMVENTIVLQIGSSYMAVNGTDIQIDENGSAPLLEGGEAMLPIKGLVEAMGGKATYDRNTKTARMEYAGARVDLVPDQAIAYINGEAKTLTTVPKLSKKSLMMPMSLMTDAFNIIPHLSADQRTVTITYTGKTIDITELEKRAAAYPPPE